MSPKIWLLLVLLAPVSARADVAVRSAGADVVASWYGERFHEGRATASGCPFHARELTAASRTLPLGTVLRVTRAGRMIEVTVTDRGPYIAGRQLDLSRAAAELLGMHDIGVSKVQAEIVGSRTLHCRRKA